MRIGNGISLGRFLIVSLALVANLLAVGVPVLHAFAHERHAHAHDRGDHEAADSIGLANDNEHPHSEVHAAGLHEDMQVLPRTAVDFGAVAQPKPSTALFAVISSERSPVPEGILHSRAPPGDATARAPPLQ